MLTEISSSISGNIEAISGMSTEFGELFSYSTEELRLKLQTAEAALPIKEIESLNSDFLKTVLVSILKLHELSAVDVLATSTQYTKTSVVSLQVIEIPESAFPTLLQHLSTIQRFLRTTDTTMLSLQLLHKTLPAIQSGALSSTDFFQYYFRYLE